MTGSLKIPVMKVCFSRLLASALILPATLLGVSTAAHADRPWQDVPTPAQVIKEFPLSQPLAPVLTALPAGTPFTLSKNGKLYRLDPVDGRLTTLMDELPPLSAVTATAQGLWAVAPAPKPELLNLAPDTGVILNHIIITKVLTTGSHIAAMRIAHDTAILADDGVPAFIIIDLKTGKMQRLLEGSPTLSGHGPLMRRGQPVTTASGQAETGGNIRFLALDHNRQWLFYQAPTGPLYRIGTNLLTDPSLGPAERIEGMANWRRTPSLGGLTIDSHDVLYMADIEHGDLLAFGPDRIPLRLLHDDRLYDAQALTVLKDKTSPQRHLAVLLGPTAADSHYHLLEIALP